MVKYIYRKCLQHKWFNSLIESSSSDSTSEDSSTASTLGVALRRPVGSYATEPSNLSTQLLKAANRVNAAVAFSMSSDVTELLFQQMAPLQTEIPLDPYGAVLPVVNSIDDLASETLTVAQDAYICACRRERFVFVWGTSAQGIITHGSDVESRLIGLVSAIER